MYIVVINHPYQPAMKINTLERMTCSWQSLSQEQQIVLRTFAAWTSPSQPTSHVRLSGFMEYFIELTNEDLQKMESLSFIEMDDGGIGFASPEARTVAWLNGFHEM